MFIQFFLNIMGAVYGQTICQIFLVFYASRLLVFIFDTVLALRMVQSNMTCVALAICGCVMALNGSVGFYAVAASLLLIIDAVLGAGIYVALNEKEISQVFQSPIVLVQSVQEREFNFQLRHLNDAKRTCKSLLQTSN